MAQRKHISDNPTVFEDYGDGAGWSYRGFFPDSPPTMAFDACMYQALALKTTAEDGTYDVLWKLNCLQVYKHTHFCPRMFLLTRIGISLSCLG